MAGVLVAPSALHRSVSFEVEQAVASNGTHFMQLSFNDIKSDLVLFAIYAASFVAWELLKLLAYFARSSWIHHVHTKPKLQKALKGAQAALRQRHDELNTLQQQLFEGASHLLACDSIIKIPHSTDERPYIEPEELRHSGPMWRAATCIMRQSSKPEVMYAQIDALTSTKPSKAIVPLLQESLDWFKFREQYILKIVEAQGRVCEALQRRAAAARQP